MNKALKIVMYAAIVLITLIFLLGSLLFAYILHLSWPQNYQCWQSKGTWTGFPTGCHDECYYLNHDKICTEAFSTGCECGLDKCWNGSKCIKDGDWQPS